MIKKYSGEWTDKQVKHLLRRTLFGITLEDERFFTGKSLDECLDILLMPTLTPAPPPYLDNDDADVPEGTTWVFGKQKPGAENQRMLFLKSWIIGLMRDQRNISERMVLFWHNHFATEFNTVKDTRYNYQYFALIRQHATGNFKKLLEGMTINTQMLVYLNGNLNYKTNPNENYAREVQELFTLGKGPDSHYTEQDVKNAAKVLTGWKDDKEAISSYFDPEAHNTEDKMFSSFYNNYVIKGRSGADGAGETNELLEMICKQAEVSRFLCRKLYRWFVSSNIDEQVEKNIIVPLAEIMVSANYEVKDVLKAILSSDFFYEPHLTGSIIKGPVDFAVELLRVFGITNPFVPEMRINAVLSTLTAAMGQNIGDPPAVAGWPAYYEFPLFDKEWISSDKLFTRSTMIKALCRKPSKADLENNFCLLLLEFVTQLSKPEDDRLLLIETMDLIFCVPLGEGQVTYLLGLLNKSNNFTESWNKLWLRYNAAKENAELAEEVRGRLRNTFQALLMFPEYQIR